MKPTEKQGQSLPTLDSRLNEALYNIKVTIEKTKGASFIAKVKAK